MAAELLQVPEVAEHFSGNPVWQWLGRHSGHVGWTGCTLHDLIQPSFSFMVGVALPFSLAGRLSAGATPGKLWLHACWRGLVLVLLGVFLRSIGREQTYWTFEDTLSQIGLGYPLLFALGFARWRTVWITLGLLLAGYWALFALWPLPGLVSTTPSTVCPPAGRIISAGLPRIGISTVTPRGPSTAGS